jgi:DNA modification methylase
MQPYYQDEASTIYHGDSRDVLPLVDPGSVDLVLTDPPYGIDHDPTSTLWNVADAIANDHEPFDPAPLLAFGRCILWGADNYAHRLPPTRGWLVWEKRNGRDSSQSGLRIPDCELAWTNVLTRHRVYSQLWAGPMRSPAEPFLHPTQKSVSLMRWTLEHWSAPGDLILDPYMGSGPVAQACKELGRRYIGIDVEERWCRVVVEQRLSQQSLFAFGAS